MKGWAHQAWMIAAACLLTACVVGGCGRRQADETPRAAADDAESPAAQHRTAAKPPHNDYIVVTPAAKALNTAPDSDLALPAEGRQRAPAPPLPESVPLTLPPAAALADPLPPFAEEHRPEAPENVNPLRGGETRSEVLPLQLQPTVPQATITPTTARTVEVALAASEKQEPAPKTEAPPADEKKLPPQRKGKHSGEAFDPVKVNGPVFEGWPKPKLALLITGREEGYIEPCGCAGLDRMKGGMARRYSLFKQLRQDGWEVVGLDVGGIAKGFGKQAELKFQNMIEGKRQMGYDAIAFGATDLKLPAGELLSMAAPADGKPSTFVSANVGLFDFATEVMPKFKIIDRPGAKLAVTAIVGKQAQKQIHNDEIVFADPEKALKDILPEMKKKAGYLVLLAHATVEESTALAKQFPEFNLVVTAGGPAEPPGKLTLIEGTKTIIVETGEKGMNAVVIGYFDDAKHPVRYQRVPLDSRFAAAKEMKLLVTAYQDQLKTLRLAERIPAVPHPQKEINGAFVGSEKCAPCHDESMRVWRKTGHSRAFATLERLDPPRHHDPECISCHVVGWHPTKYFPYETGFVSKEKTPHLIDTGCEDCHGPGEKHVIAEAGGDLELQKRLRKAMVVTKEESAKRQCYTCHDLDNSPDFEFESYWPIIEHKEE